MTGITNNPARVALLTEMAEQTDGGAKVWEEQPATRNGTKNALLRDGYVTIAKGGKASITSKGREAVTACTLKAMTSQVALEAGTPTKGEEAKGEEAKAKFEAARAEVVKPAKKRAAAEAKPEAKTDTRFTKAAKAKAVEDTRKLSEPAQQAEQPAPEQPAPVADEQPEMDPTDPRGSKLARIILDIYGVNFLEAPALALIWAASQLADLEGVEAAKTELSYCNWRRERAGKTVALPPYGSKLF